MNSVAKGRRNERKSHLLLEGKGLLTLSTVRSAHRGGANDFFGLWDHMAISLETGHVYFVQTKTNAITKKDFAAHAEFINSFKATQRFSGVVIVWVDRQKTPRVYVTNTTDSPVYEVDYDSFIDQLLIGQKL